MARCKPRSKAVNVTKSLLQPTSVANVLTVQVSLSQMTQVSEYDLSPTQGSEAAFQQRREGKLDTTVKLCSNWKQGGCRNHAACSFAHVMSLFNANGSTPSPLNGRGGTDTASKTTALDMRLAADTPTKTAAAYVGIAATGALKGKAITTTTAAAGAASRPSAPAAPEVVTATSSLSSDLHCSTVNAVSSDMGYSRSLADQQADSSASSVRGIVAAAGTTPQPSLQPPLQAREMSEQKRWGGYLSPVAQQARLGRALQSGGIAEQVKADTNDGSGSDHLDTVWIAPEMNSEMRGAEVLRKPAGTVPKCAGNLTVRGPVLEELPNLLEMNAENKRSCNTTYSSQGFTPGAEEYPLVWLKQRLGTSGRQRSGASDASFKSAELDYPQVIRRLMEGLTGKEYRDDIFTAAVPELKEAFVKRRETS